MPLLSLSIRSYSSFLLLCISVLVTGTYGDCGPPPRLTEAELRPEYQSQDVFSENSTVQYNCRPGYVRFPGRQRILTCLSSSTWSTPEEFCSRRQCPSLSEIENGYFEAKDFLFGTRANYFCHEGYRMISGRPYRDCTADGTWSNADPVCEAVICPPPDNIPDGSYSPVKDEYSYQDAVTYSCNNNLALVGTSSVSCGTNSTWSSETPTCRAVDCQDPKVPNSEKLSGFVGPFTLNSGVSFKCKDGFVMKGSSASSCNIDSEWEPPLPECQRTSVTTRPPITGDICPDPIVPNTEKLPEITGHYREGAVITITCSEGFILEGSSTSTCRVNQWNPPLPKCEEKRSHTVVIAVIIVVVLLVIIIIIVGAIYWKKKSGAYYCDNRIGDGKSRSSDISPQTTNETAQHICMNSSDSKEKV